MTLALACSIALGLVVAPDTRHRLVTLLAPLAVSYLVAAVLTAPFLYFLLADFQRSGIHPQQLYVTDLLNVVVPTSLVLSARGWAASIAHHFPGNDSERDAYLGIPTLVIIALFGWRRWRTAGGLFLIGALLIAAIASFGDVLTVDGKTSLWLPWGHHVFPLPWEHLGYLPLFNNVLAARLALFVVLPASVIVALWTAARRPGVLRVLLPVLAILAIVPDPSAGVWASTYTVPPLFTAAADRSCLRAHENVLPLPVNQNGSSDLWQVAADFRFTMAGGYVVEHPPASALDSHAAVIVALGSSVPASKTGILRAYIRAKHVTSVVVDKSQARFWASALDTIAPRQDVGGVLLYRVAGATTNCS